MRDVVISRRPRHGDSEPPELPLPESAVPIDPGVRRLFVGMLRDVMVVLRAFRDEGEFRLQTYVDYRWIRSDDESWPFAFRNVCFGLGYDALAVREALAHLDLLSTRLAVKVYEYERPPRPKRRRKKKPRRSDADTVRDIVGRIARWAGRPVKKASAG